MNIRQGRKIYPLRELVQPWNAFTGCGEEGTRNRAIGKVQDSLGTSPAAKLLEFTGVECITVHAMGKEMDCVLGWPLKQ